jgi:purine-nucleoside phosphorylase
VHSLQPDLATGVYVGTHGPEFESPAEIRAYGILGADLVGMSTVLEAIAARERGMEVLGLSLVTNLAAGITSTALDAQHFLAVGRSAGPRLTDLIVQILERL